MMFALVDGQRRLASPDMRATCPSCNGELVAKCGLIRIWHWAHAANDCDPWAEPESEWHLGWKKNVPDDRTEVVITRGDVTHRADILAHNGAVLELQAGSISAEEILARESFYKHMAWLYRVTWADRLHYGKKGFWWKHGSIVQTSITKPLFWEFEDEGIVQHVKLKCVDNTDSYGRGTSNRVLGYAIKTYERGQFVNFLTRGTLT